jgi:tetratricopeptide (TPR) repeat protein
MKRLPAAVLLIFFSSALQAQSPTVGEVSFQNSGAPAAQSDFLHGLAQLHNFEYDDAAAHFRRAEEIDPAFAMAYWGEAMTKNHGVWHDQDLHAARAILEKLAPTPEARQAKAATPREKQYLSTIEVLYGDGTKEDRDQKYAAAMADLHKKFPDDVDATAFYALAILSSAENGRDFATYMRAAALLEEVFPTHPHHPGVVHYLIHSYDDPIHAPLGLRAARIYAQFAPEAGHAQHMTSHIFLAMGMWEDVVKANETAVAVVNKQRADAGRPPAACGHYPYWLEYGYLQLGRFDDARRVLEACRAEALRQADRMSKNPTPNRGPVGNSVGSYADMRANFLINSELWQHEVVRWTFPPGDYPSAQLTLDYATALAAYKTSDFAAANIAREHMEDDARLARAWIDKHDAGDTNSYAQISIFVDQISALLYASNSATPNVTPPQAIALLKSIAEKERALPLEFGPPAINKPTDELLGELYLQLHRPADAKSSFESDLARAPGRTLALRSLSQANQQLAATILPADAAKPSAASTDHVHH